MFSGWDYFSGVSEVQVPYVWEDPTDVRNILCLSEALAPARLTKGFSCLAWTELQKNRRAGEVEIGERDNSFTVEFISN